MFILCFKRSVKVTFKCKNVCYVEFVVFEDIQSVMSVKGRPDEKEKQVRARGGGTKKESTRREDRCDGGAMRRTEKTVEKKDTG